MSGLALICLLLPGAAAGALAAAEDPGVPVGEGYRVVDRGGKKGLVDAAGREVIPVENRFVAMGRRCDPLRSTLPLILQAPDRSAIVVLRIAAGQPIIVRYDEIVLGSSGSSEGPKSWLVRRGRKWGAIDADGRELLAPIHELSRVAEGGQAGLWEIKLDGKVGLFNPGMGKVVLPAEYDWIEPTADFYWPRAAKKGGKVGVVDEGGRVVAPFQYDAIDDGGPSWPRRVQRAGKWGLLDGRGRERVAPRFDAMEAAEGPAGALYLVRAGPTWGAVDAQGHVVLPTTYDRLSGLFWKYLWAEQGGVGTWIDLRGRHVDPANPRLRHWHRAVGPEAIVSAVSQPLALPAGTPAQLRLVAFPDRAPLRFANVAGSGEPDERPRPNRLVEQRPGFRDYFLVAVDNGSDQPFDPFTENGAYLIAQEAQDRSGGWRPIEYRLLPVDNLGPRSPIPPRMRRESLARRYQGPFKTKLRLVMVTGAELLRSEPFDGSIDERQLQRPAVPGAQALEDLQPSPK